MTFTLVVLAVAACLPSNSPPATMAASTASEMPAPYQPPDPEDLTVGLRLKRLESECNQGDARSCAIASRALTSYDPMVTGSHIDKAESLQYAIKGCELGSASTCFDAAELLSKDSTQESDSNRIIKYYSNACDISNNNPMQGFACAELGQYLLRQSGKHFENYEQAMSLFQRACTLQPSTCEYRTFYAGTGLVSSTTAPTGAVGYDFGITKSAAKIVCQEKGGQFHDNPVNKLTICNKMHIDTLSEIAMYVGLDFCDGLLCEISVALHAESNSYIKRYHQLRDQLGNYYGKPGTITLKVPDGCRHDAELPECISNGKAQFGASWQWPSNEALLIRLMAYSNDMIILIAYYNAASTRALSSKGL